MRASQVSKEHYAISGRNIRPVNVGVADVKKYLELAKIGINIDDRTIGRMLDGMGFDSAQVAPLSTLTSMSILTPVQFLQQWLPGFVRVISAARKIDELIGISTTGSWEDEEIVQGIMEPVGNAELYSDYGNIPLSSYNTVFERRTVIRFEKGMQVGALEEARAARLKVSTAAEKRTSATLALEISRNRVGFFGFSNGTNRTFGFLNDPSLPAYVPVAAGVGGLPWSTKTFLEITADIRAAAAALQTNSQDTIDPAVAPITYVLATAVVQYLSVTNALGTTSVRQWINETYPSWRIVSAPELNGANGGANVSYLFAENVDDGSTDDSRTWIQVVPAKFQTLGVEKRSKTYLEDYTNATAGAMCKRPYAVYRQTGM